MFERNPYIDLMKIFKYSPVFVQNNSVRVRYVSVGPEINLIDQSI